MNNLVNVYGINSVKNIKSSWIVQISVYLILTVWLLFIQYICPLCCSFFLHERYFEVETSVAGVISVDLLHMI
jgi:hypothetical protein